MIVGFPIPSVSIQLLGFVRRNANGSFKTRYHLVDGSVAMATVQLG